MSELATLKEWASQSEAHARTALQAYRNSLRHARLARADADADATRALENINEAKRIMFENGWTEE
jgi:hypothetical protein